MSEPTTTSLPQSSLYRRATTALARTWTTKTSTPAPKQQFSKLPPISDDRLTSSLKEKSPEGHIPDPQAIEATSDPDQTYLYLAYGSNLAASTFRGVRGIRPLAALNVVVPELVMTFDLAGLPYIEPCFANTAYITHPPPSPTQQQPGNTSPSNEKSPLLSPTYSNPHWPKGLVGVVYEVTPTDYAHIIATEGGGASYRDVLVTCHPLLASTPTVPSNPTTPAFKAHTLYSPLSPPGSGSKRGRHLSRPDPNYAQPSQRYINLIRTGAEEHGIPHEYRDYLDELKPYTITTRGQEMGRFVFQMTWLPILSAVFGLSK
ncbi:MAG: hypothetical protein Q9170_008393, partial [Blastenia crenularia]